MAERKTILVVDDIVLNRTLLKGILDTDYEVLEAENGMIALQQVAKHRNEICAILLDIVMPELDGFGVLKELQSENLLNKIPVLLISADSSVEFEREGYKCGAFDFIHKPFDNMIVKARTDRAVELYTNKNRLETVVDQQTYTLRKQIEKLEQQDVMLREVNNDIIEIMSTIVEFRDVESGLHVQRIKSYTRELAKVAMEHYPEYGIMPDEVEQIASAAVLHDIGKIAIPDSVLLKPGRLTKEEFEEMKLHTVKGAEIIKSLEAVQEPHIHKLSMEICRHHHEKYDGKGYPDGLKGDEIPIEAQLVSIADCFDALSNERVYKPAFNCETAFKMICNGECGVFSPKLIDCFTIAYPEMVKIHDYYYAKEHPSDESEPVA